MLKGDEINSDDSYNDFKSEDTSYQNHGQIKTTKNFTKHTKSPSNWKFISETILNNQPRNFPITKDNLLIYAVTWNMKGKKPSKEEIQLLLNRNSGKFYHLYVIGTQECMRSILSSLFYSNKSDWINMIQEELGEDYILLKEESLSALHLAIFVNYSIITEINNISSSKIKTGVGNLVGNKGATAIGFNIRNKNFLFINSHLAAGQNSTEKRNRDFHRINTTLNIKNFTSQGGKSITDLFNVSIWMGDFNYRVECNPEEAINLIKTEETYKLLDYDQMHIEMKNNREIFNNFAEGIIEFRPTYKYHTGEENINNYDLDKRKPSWTDRILYKCEDYNLVLCKYNCINDTYISDHKPVFAVFRYDFIEDNQTLIESVKVTHKSQLCNIF